MEFADVSWIAEVAQVPSIAESAPAADASRKKPRKIPVRPFLSAPLPFSSCFTRASYDEAGWSARLAPLFAADRLKAARRFSPDEKHLFRRRRCTIMEP